MVKTRMFSIHIPAANLVKLPKSEWDRLVKFVTENCDSKDECRVYRDPIEHTWSFSGTANSKVISLLMAVARGHDLVALLAKFEKEE